MHAEKIRYVHPEESLVNKDWAAGTQKILPSDEFLIYHNGTNWVSTYTSINYAPAWYKMIDEIVVNALDQFIKMLFTKTPVTDIRVNFDRETGQVKVYNDGPGIPSDIHEEASAILGQKTRIPTLLFGYRDQTENRIKKLDSITGGTNGIGGKLTNALSSTFSIETVFQGTYFFQKWTNNMRTRHEPVIYPSDRLKVETYRKIDHTLISFIPDYCGNPQSKSEIEFYRVGFGYEKYDNALYDELSKLVCTRVVHAALYCEYTLDMYKHVKPKPIMPSVTYNGMAIPFTSMEDIARLMFPNADMVRTRLIPNKSIPAAALYKYPWELLVVATNTNKSKRSLAMVNGILCDGKHVDYITNLLVSDIITRTRSVLKDKSIKITPANVTHNIFVMINAKIPHDGIAWVGQRKDVLNIPPSKLAMYTIPQDAIALITGQVKDSILDKVLSKTVAKTTDYDKYRRASKLTSQPDKCSLIVAEGDSAMNRIISGLASSPELDPEYYGIISTGGVLVNVKKETKFYERGYGKQFTRSKKLVENKFINAFVSILGLNYKYDYDPTGPNFKKQRAELKYGKRVIIMPDQDMDGKGKILGLLMTIFDTYWPKLYDAGYICWFQTDIVRLYPKGCGDVLSFKSLETYRQRLAGLDVEKYKPTTYYKGLATHSKNEFNYMLSELNDRIYSLYCDKDSPNTFEIYYGKDPALRKMALSKEMVPPNLELITLQDKERRISCTDHLRIEVDAYQRNDLEQKLPHIIDGCNQSARKILVGVIKYFAKQNKPIAVFRLCGFITTSVGYDHGETSLSESLTRRGKIDYAGGVQLPIIFPESMFGSRFGDDAGQNRYIKCRSNNRLTQLLYPPQDYHLCEFAEDRAIHKEPLYLVPIVPAVHENCMLPSHGWGVTMYARDVFAIIKEVKNCINSGNLIPTRDFPLCKYDHFQCPWTGEEHMVYGKLCMFGKYRLHANILTITELPLCVWTTHYLGRLRKKMATEDGIIVDILDQSTDVSVKIIVTLAEDAIAKLDRLPYYEHQDPVEEYFELREAVSTNINMMSVDKKVIHLDRYCDILQHWFPVRKAMYEKRFRYDQLLLELKIEKQKNIVRFIQDKKSPSRGKKAIMESYLAQNGYAKMDSTLLAKPKLTKLEDLRDLVTQSKKASYSYLLGLSDYDKSDESLEEEIMKLAKLENDLVELRKDMQDETFIGKATWLRELDELEKVILEGFKSGWAFGRDKKYKFK